MAEKKVSKTQVKSVLTDLQKVLDEEATIDERKSAAAKELHDLIGSAEVVWNGQRLKAVKRVRDKGKETEHFEYFIRGMKSSDAAFVF